MSVGAQVVDAIAAQGWAVEPAFVSGELVHGLAEDARARLRAGQFRPAGVSKCHAVRENVRRDAIHWLEPPGAGSAQQACLTRFDALRLALNRELQLGLFDFECHYACYPPGAFYRRHLDRFAEDDRRVVSCILYLNDAWMRAEGGQLRLYRDPGVEEVLPEAGTLVAFLSERFQHEVLPATRERLSLTGWFRRRGSGF